MGHRELQQKLAASRSVTHSCPGCNAPVRCEIEQGKNTCWCFTVHNQRPEVDWDSQCLCQHCLTLSK